MGEGIGIETLDLESQTRGWYSALEAFCRRNGIECTPVYDSSSHSVIFHFSVGELLFRRSVSVDRLSDNQTMMILFMEAGGYLRYAKEIKEFDPSVKGGMRCR